jgi:hypothetical protein
MLGIQAALKGLCQFATFERSPCHLPYRNDFFWTARD